MQELFPVGRTVGPADLVGREPAIDSMVDRLAAGQSLTLAGPRRIGKTSVVKEALRRLGDQGALTGMVDLLRVTNLEDLAEAIIDACLHDATGVAKASHAIRSWIRGYTPQLKLQTKWGDLTEIALSIAGKAEKTTGTELLDEALALPQKLAERSGRRFVLAYDEFQELSRIAPEILGRMRSTMIHQDKVTFLFLGSQESLLQQLFTKRNEPFYRFSTDWRLPPVPSQEWSNYLQRRYLDFGFPAASVVVDDLVRRSGGHPMDTMLLANEAIYIAREGKTHQITLEAVSSAYERVMLNLSRAFEETWHSLDPAAQQVVKRTAAGIGPYTKAISNPATVKRSIDKMLNNGLLERYAPGRYRLIEPMFGEYVRRRLS